MSELKPCPFCGGEDTHLHRELLQPSNRQPGKTRYAYFGRCRGCGSQGGMCAGFQNQERAIKAWNARQDGEVQRLQGEVERYKGNWEDLVKACEEKQEGLDANKELAAEWLTMKDVNERLRGEVEKYTNASSSKTDWCPVCEQGWDCAKEDVKHRKLLRKAELQLSEARDCLEIANKMIIHIGCIYCSGDGIIQISVGLQGEDEIQPCQWCDEMKQVADCLSKLTTPAVPVPQDKGEKYQSLQPAFPCDKCGSTGRVNGKEKCDCVNAKMLSK